MFGAETLKNPMEQPKDSNDGCKGEVDLMAVGPIGGSDSSRPDEVSGEVHWPKEQQQCRRATRPKVVMARKCWKYQEGESLQEKREV
jgi:hypothetical protein